MAEESEKYKVAKKKFEEAVAEFQSAAAEENDDPTSRILTG